MIINHVSFISNGSENDRNELKGLVKEVNDKLNKIKGNIYENS